MKASRTAKKGAAIGASCLALLFLFYLLCLNHTEPTELGVARNIITGQYWAQERGGWHLTAPWVRVARIDLRPVRVSVQSAGRGYSAKLAEFVPSEWRSFVATEGFRYWWWANRFSFNGGYGEEHRGMKDIMRGYAYSSKRYPFVRVMDEDGKE